ncbi:MAG TPA: aminotransferase class I/II-fold pyridoxal phosphate-dependent enzyme, partial [Ignavibacteria bacterium]|nr:aminotransferase class I/II-fold pyridoxal phosphate-dependent enzyme [Ignavibacteria bacterium]
YFELRNIPEDVLAQFTKQQSISLCSNVVGQVATYLMVTPPVEGEESYDLYMQERNGILSNMKEKARILGEGLNKIPGMFCEVPEGAMYAFVRFELPDTEDTKKMSENELVKYEAKRDEQYCMSLLEETNICVVPGSGFGQKPGTMHFRTTFLPPKEDIEALVEKMKVFHTKYSASIK